MPLDEIDYITLIEKIHDLFIASFKENIVFIAKQEAIEHMEYFKIQYKYLPLQYDIVFESEHNIFTIDIYDCEGAKNTLYRIEKYNNETKINNVQAAIQLLKEILQNDDLYFYITQNGKIYRKKGQQYKRIKDLTEITENSKE